MVVTAPAWPSGALPSPPDLAVRLIAGVRAGQGKAPVTCILHIRRVRGPCPAPARPTPGGHPRHCQARPPRRKLESGAGETVPVPQQGESDDRSNHNWTTDGADAIIALRRREELYLSHDGEGVLVKGD